MLDDLRIAARSLRRELGVTAIIVGTLALGIGTTTAIFSVVEAVLIRPLPYHDPENLVRVLNRNSYPDLVDWDPLGSIRFE